MMAICGVLRERSSTRLALTHVLGATSEAGATTELIDLRHVDLPLFDPDDPQRGDVTELKRLVRNADSVVMGTSA